MLIRISEIQDNVSIFSIQFTERGKNSRYIRKDTYTSQIEEKKTERRV